MKSMKHTSFTPTLQTMFTQSLTDVSTEESKAVSSWGELS